MKMNPTEEAYADTLRKLRSAMDEFEAEARKVIAGLPQPYDAWETELWRLLCDLSQALQNADVAYHRLREKERQEHAK